MSIAEVARHAGVSRATVSRVINRRSGVSAEIVQAVRNAVTELGYHPPPLERRPGRRVPLPDKDAASLIAVVLVDSLYQHTPGVFASHLRGIEREASEHKVGVLVVQIPPTGKVPKSLSHKQIEGLILLGSRAEQRVLDELNTHVAVWLSSHHDSRGDTVLAGNQDISRIAVDYLIARGHKHLGFLAVASTYPAYPARAEAFHFFAANRQVKVVIQMDSPAEAAGVDFNDTADLQKRIGVQVEKLLALPERPSGLFIPNDMMTAMAYVELRARGVVPGRDVDVISCNNEISYLLGLSPRPATIDIGAELIGRRSVEQLLRRIRYPEESRQVQIAVTPVLVEGTPA